MIRDGTLSEEIAQSTVYHHLKQIFAYLHFTIMHKVIGVTQPLHVLNKPIGAHHYILVTGKHHQMWSSFPL